MVDAVDSKSIAERRGGSSPSWGTNPIVEKNTVPRLLCLNTENDYVFSEFFSKTRWVNGHNRPDIEHDYPHMCVIHQSVLEQDPRILIDLRRYIERSAHGDAVYFTIRKEYKYCWNYDTAKNDWDRNWDNVRNDQWQIYFERSEDLTMFKLMKPGMLHDKIFEFHPDYDYHTKENTRSW